MSFQTKLFVMSLIAQKKYMTPEIFWADLQAHKNVIELGANWVLAWDSTRQGIYACNRLAGESFCVCFYPNCYSDYAPGSYCSHSNVSELMRKRKASPTPDEQPQKKIRMSSESLEQFSTSGFRAELMDNIFVMAFQKSNIHYYWKGDLDAHCELLAKLKTNGSLDIPEAGVIMSAYPQNDCIYLQDKVTGVYSRICAHTGYPSYFRNACVYYECVHLLIMFVLGCHENGTEQVDPDWYCADHFCGGRKIGGNL